ncbi:unnamed protein product [Dovyalis caffra]|uniref:Maturase K n=1 Tax=Dovyalis caffra TaxID=77055 RepID=A0AAV1SPB1_9ROSI|nr:unnamed protein product [Dovyalis caffra]
MTTSIVAMFSKVYSGVIVTPILAQLTSVDHPRSLLFREKLVDFFQALNNKWPWKSSDQPHLLLEWTIHTWRLIRNSTRLTYLRLFYCSIGWKILRMLAVSRKNGIDYGVVVTNFFHDKMDGTSSSKTIKGLAKDISCAMIKVNLPPMVNDIKALQGRLDCLLVK